ncbi:MAG TPA: ABC transporter [Chloroflexi bacterium]|jgi:putative ABC transport system ATP-binding protein|nr:ABC transporter [Chloroflexota bacterium]
MQEPVRLIGKAHPGRGANAVVEAVAKRYATDRNVVAALDSVSFTADPGSLVAVMGPSGSGKSTLLHLIGAMDTADEGRIVVGDYEVTKLARREQPAYRRRIGFVFQRFHLLPALTALDNVAAPLLPYHVDFDKHERARTLLAGVGLGDREQALPSELSGGEQQRVAIARALVNEPFLLLADEPTGNLDSRTGAEIMELLLELRERHGMTVIVATHDAVVASACERIIRLRDGQVVDEMTVPRNVDLDDVLERISRLDPTA